MILCVGVCAVCSKKLYPCITNRFLFIQGKQLLLYITYAFFYYICDIKYPNYERFQCLHQT